MAQAVLPRTADAVVVGGGCMGVSTAYQLALRGLDVVLVEQGELASGTTGRSSAIVRTHYTLEPLVRMAQAALDDFRHWGERLPGDPGFREVGFLLLVSEENRRQLEANVAMQRALGVRTETVDAAAAAAAVPGMAVEDVGAAAHEPHSGYADPWLVVSSLAAGAAERGAVIATGVTATAIRRDRTGAVSGVATSMGDVAAPIVVNAGGNWADRISRPIGVPLSITPQRESLVLVDLPPGLGDPPIVIDMVQMMYVRPHGRGRLLFGDEDHTLDALHPRLGSPDDGDLSMPGPLAVENAALKLMARFPALAEGSLVPAGYTGRYEVTPDFQPLIGQPDEVPGYLYAAGFSGHGFKLTPVIGRLMAQWAVEGAPGMDLTGFDAGRFERNQPLRAPHPYRSGVGLI